MRGTSYMRIPEELSIKTAPTKGNRTLTILIPFPNSLQREAGQWTGLSKTERQISVVRSSKAVYSGQKKPKWIFHLTSTDLWHNENTSGLHVLVHCSMASEVVEIFPLFLYFFQLGRYYRKNIFPILLFGSCSCKRVVSWQRDISEVDG